MLQPCGDAKGMNSFFHAGSGSNNIGFDFISMIVKLTDSKLAYRDDPGSALGWEAFNVSKLDFHALVTAKPVKFVDLAARMKEAAAKATKDEPAPTFVTKIMPKFFVKKIDFIDNEEAKYLSKKTFADDKAKKKWRMKKANKLGIGIHRLRKHSHYELVTVGPLHLMLRFGDKWAVLISVWRKLFRKEGVHHVAGAQKLLSELLPMEAKKLQARMDTISYNKTIACSFNGEKVNILLNNTEGLCAEIARSITETGNRADYKRCIVAVFGFLFERGNEFFHYMYADLSTEAYRSSSSHWKIIFERGLQTLRSINHIASFLLTPTVIRVFCSMPHSLFSIAYFNEMHGTKFTMRDFDENRMEFLNKEVKTQIKQRHMRACEGFEPTMGHFVACHVGGLKERLISFAHTDGQKRKLTREANRALWSLDGYDERTTQMIEALREGKTVPYIQDNEVVKKLQQLADWIKKMKQDEGEKRRVLEANARELAEMEEQENVECGFPIQPGAAEQKQEEEKKEQQNNQEPTPIYRKNARKRGKGKGKGKNVPDGRAEAADPPSEQRKKVPMDEDYVPEEEAVDPPSEQRKKAPMDEADALEVEAADPPAARRKKAPIDEDHAPEAEAADPPAARRKKVLTDEDYAPEEEAVDPPAQRRKPSRKRKEIPSDDPGHVSQIPPIETAGKRRRTVPRGRSSKSRRAFEMMQAGKNNSNSRKKKPISRKNKAKSRRNRNVKY